MKSLAAELQKRREQSLYRSRRVVDGPQDVVLRIGGGEVLSFCSNDYLGLASHPEVVQALCDGAKKYGAGSGAAHLISGHSRAHHDLEEALAEFTGRQRALLFSTGYMANLGAVTALTGRHDLVFEDRLNHASLIDAGLASGAEFVRYTHGDTAELTQKLAQYTAKRRLIVTDGVFSMDGDLAPLQELAPIAQHHDAWLMVDDAHGFGVLGEHGGGCAEHFGLSPHQLPVLMGTLGKAFGTFGAFVAGDDDLIEYLIQTARPYIYTTAMPPAVAYATLTSLRLLKEETWRRQHLTRLIRLLRSNLDAIGIPLMPSLTPIQPLLVGDAAAAMAMSEGLRQRGILVSAIRPPTVPQGTARLRITLSAAHSEAQVNRLCESLGEVWRERAGPA